MWKVIFAWLGALGLGAVAAYAAKSMAETSEHWLEVLRTEGRLALVSRISRDTCHWSPATFKTTIEVFADAESREHDPVKADEVRQIRQTLEETMKRIHPSS